MGFLDFLFGKKEEEKKKAEEKKKEEEKTKVEEERTEAETAPHPEEQEGEATKEGITSGELVTEEGPTEENRGEEQVEARSTIFGMPAPDLPDSPGQKTEESEEEGAAPVEAPQAVSGEMVVGEAGDTAEEEKEEAVAGAEPSSEPAAEAHPGAESQEEAVPAAADEAPTEPMEEDEIEKMLSSGERMSSGSFIVCKGCGKRLPVPYVGYPSKITCPFCLTVNEYNM